MNHLRLGSWGEEIGIKYLQAHNYQIISRNYRKKWGEIDIVAFDGQSKETVFLEVKTINRLNTASLLPEEELTPEKMLKLKRVILSFLSQYHLEDKPWRFDFLAIEIQNNALEPDLRHYKDVYLEF
ncbi:MAG: YraN family protein [Parcubacteria group bacterium]|nr:YraN family protein [Parcubacteria group bacterium]